MIPSPAWSLAFQNLVRGDARPMLMIGRHGEILDASPSAYQRFGGSREALMCQPFNHLVMRTRQAATREALESTFEKGRGICETRLRLPSGKGVSVVVSLAVLNLPGEPVALAFVRRAPKPSQTADLARVDHLFVMCAIRQEFLHGIVNLARQISGCACAGIRELDTEGNIPYVAEEGFPLSFMQQEGQLSISRDNCVCTRAVTGEYQVQDLPILTEGGSFQVNDPHEYVFALHPLLLAHEYRGMCWQVGFQSIAAIPIRDNGRVSGVMHIADPHPGMLGADMLRLLEAVAQKVGEMLLRYQQIEMMQAALA
ncbi:MAG TPA: GAF domain-containing protein [Anaerolineaceae bacterium]